MARNITGVATNFLVTTGSPAALNIAKNAPVEVAYWVNFNSFAASATLLGKDDLHYDISSGPPYLWFLIEPHARFLFLHLML
jgi:hypothetical protein